MPGYAITAAVDAQFTGLMIDPVGLSGVDERGLLQVEPAIHHVDEEQPVHDHTLGHPHLLQHRHTTTTSRAYAGPRSQRFAPLSRSGSTPYKPSPDRGMSGRVIAPLQSTTAPRRNSFLGSFAGLRKGVSAPVEGDWESRHPWDQGATLDENLINVKLARRQLNPK